MSLFVSQFNLEDIRERIHRIVKAAPSETLSSFVVIARVVPVVALVAALSTKCATIP